MSAPDLRDLVRPAHTALLLQEVQEGVIGTFSRLPELAHAAQESGAVANMALLAVAARRAGGTVIHCTAQNLPGGFGRSRNARVFGGAERAGMANATGSPGVAPVPAVGPEPGDVVLPRFHGLSPLTGSPLDSLLRNQGITSLVVAGVSLNIAIPNLVFDAVNRSYQVVVAGDAVAGVPLEYGHDVIRHTLHLVSTVATTAEIVAAWAV